MKERLNIWFGIMIALAILSCSPNNDSQGKNTEKKLIKISYGGIGGQVLWEENFFYDANGNLIEIKDGEGFVTTSFSYNSSNLLVKKIVYQDNDDSSFEIIKNISYNGENKISFIEEVFNIYNQDGSLYNQGSNNNIQIDSNKRITYGPNSMTSTYEQLDGVHKAEYTFSNNLITHIKLFIDDELIANMSFAYDDEGNCISGTGPYKPGQPYSFGLYDTDDIDLSVTYGNEEKNPFFNTFFDFNILDHDSFYYISEALVKQQGTKYPERMQWYLIEGYSNKENNDYSFDDDGYIISNTQDIYSSSPSIIRYTWE